MLAVTNHHAGPWDKPNRKRRRNLNAQPRRSDRAAVHRRDGGGVDPKNEAPEQNKQVASSGPSGTANPALGNNVNKAI